MHALGGAHVHTVLPPGAAQCPYTWSQVWGRAGRSPHSFLRVQTLCGEDKCPTGSPQCESHFIALFIGKRALKFQDSTPPPVSLKIPEYLPCMNVEYVQTDQ